MTEHGRLIRRALNGHILWNAPCVHRDGGRADTYPYHTLCRRRTETVWSMRAGGRKSVYGIVDAGAGQRHRCSGSPVGTVGSLRTCLRKCLEHLVRQCRARVGGRRGRKQLPRHALAGRPSAADLGLYKGWETGHGVISRPFAAVRAIRGAVRSVGVFSDEVTYARRSGRTASLCWLSSRGRWSPRAQSVLFLKGVPRGM